MGGRSRVLHQCLALKNELIFSGNVHWASTTAEPSVRGQCGAHCLTRGNEMWPRMYNKYYQLCQPSTLWSLVEGSKISVSGTKKGILRPGHWHWVWGGKGASPEEVGGGSGDSQGGDDECHRTGPCSPWLGCGPGALEGRERWVVVGPTGPCVPC